VRKKILSAGCSAGLKPGAYIGARGRVWTPYTAGSCLLMVMRVCQDDASDSQETTSVRGNSWLDFVEIAARGWVMGKRFA
jgi:hypothetical protein